MSANFPTSESENGLEPKGRASAKSKNNQEEADASVKQGAATLREDLATLKSDLEALLSNASTLSERELSDAYARMMGKFSSLRFAAKGMVSQAGRQFNQGVDMTSDYVKDRPLQSVAIAAGFGLVLGMVLGRR
jgi:ElaB/YqjD/DUF883 family membrane-anchored ribosome-binding protein